LSFFSLYYVFFGIFAMEQVGRRVPSLSSQACLQRLQGWKICPRAYRFCLPKKTYKISKPI
jgi:hypothetical protein